jgi:rubrerythrin
MEQRAKFTRRVENFTCENCQTTVQGNGYTNHCPKCLWSKHVDINPGDRANSCLGLMRPVDVTMKKGEYVIVHCCETCGHTKPNRSTKQDSFPAILQIAQSRCAS